MIKKKNISIIKNEKNSGKLNAYIQSILKAKSKYMMFLEEEEVLLPYLKDIFDLIATYNRDINMNNSYNINFLMLCNYKT